MNPNNKLLVLRDKIVMIFETHKRFGKSTTETEMRFRDILNELDSLEVDLE